MPAKAGIQYSLRIDRFTSQRCRRLLDRPVKPGDDKKQGHAEISRRDLLSRGRWGMARRKTQI
jgi:hypothetical protein